MRGLKLMPNIALASETEIIRVELTEVSMTGHSLGRHIHHDPRSRDYPAARARGLASVTHRSVGLPLDQGDHSCSTAHSLVGALNSAPNFAGGDPLTSADAIRIYERAAALQGDSYISGHGSSGLMACKAAVELGLIGSYEHAFGIDHALESLVLCPVMTGLKWYSSFDSPDPRTGLVERTADASFRGGHEVLADAIDVENELVWFWNSWGASYGRFGGRFCMSFETWHRLLEDQGDVTVPVK
jgi:hypothetical protein